MKLDDFFDFPATILALLREDDIPTTVAVINHAFRYQDKFKGGPRITNEELKNKAAKSSFYIAKHGTQIVGTVYIQPNETALHFGLLAVADDFRGTGLAQAMMHGIETYARASGFATLQLDYMSLVPWLKTYYETYGFYETGEIEKWGDTITLVRMQKVLS